MAVRMTVSTRSLSGLAANLLSADARAQKAIRATVARYGDKQWRLTRKLAPYDESKPSEEFHLRNQVRLRFSDDGLVYEVGFRSEDFRDAGEPEYFIFTEFGTRFMKARPCVFPARDTIKPEFKKALGRDIRAAMKRQAR
jgi:HK97 gp10 family phage protein